MVYVRDLGTFSIATGGVTEGSWDRAVRVGWFVEVLAKRVDFGALRRLWRKVLAW